MSTTGHIHQDASGAYTWERQSSQFLIVNKAQARSFPYKDHLATQRKKRDRVTHFLNQEVSVKKGLIRTLVLVVDFSKHILLEEKNSTLKPTAAVDFDETDHIQDQMEDDLEIQNDRAVTSHANASSIFTERTTSGQQKLVISRRHLIFSCLEEFVHLFFEQNPLSAIGLVIVKDNRAKTLLHAVDSSQLLLRQLRHLRDGVSPDHPDHTVYHPSGFPSIVAGLRTAKLQLHWTPKFSTRELLYINSSVQTTCDSHISIFTTIKDLKKEAITCNVLSFGGEMFILSKLAALTKGRHVVPLHVLDFRDKLLSMSKPQPVSQSVSNSLSSMLIPMGFPRKMKNMQSYCVCHQKPTHDGYICPRCHSKVCTLPAKCLTCNLLLCSSPDLARYFHHLFPVNAFLEVPRRSLSSASPLPCFACSTLMYAHSSIVTQCPSCSNHFCVDCDAFIHESLHNCPGCEATS